jgi:signal transduction histidine kinase
MVHPTMWRKLLDALPHAYNIPEEAWQRRHRLLLWVLGAHAPALVVLALALEYTPRTSLLVAIAPLTCALLGYQLRRHRGAASLIVTVGLVYCSSAFVGLTHGVIEAHFHFFVIIGFIALYQSWTALLCTIILTVVSHGIGSMWQQNLIFSHEAGQVNPWLWSLLHGVAVLAAWTGMIVFWRFTEDAQREKDVLARRLADSEINRRQFTSDLLTNLARRNQSLLHRQLEIINQLEETERDPDALSDLFALDHIATRVRRNAESLLVLAGEQPPRTWSEPVPLRDVLRAAIAETENLERVVFVVDEQSAVVGHTVTDLTHLLAELTENAVRFSPPDATVTVRSRPDRARPGGRIITIEDWGVGMTAEQIEEANELLATPPDVDLSVSQRLGFHVVARLAARHGIKVGLSVTPGSGTTALVSLPPSLFASLHPAAAATAAATAASPARAAVDERPRPPVAVQVEHRPAPPPAARRRVVDRTDWSGWWDPAVESAMPAFNPTPDPVNGAGPALNGFNPGGDRSDARVDGFGRSGAAAPIGRGADPLTNGSSPFANIFDPAANWHGAAGNGSGHDTSSGPGNGSGAGNGSGPARNGIGPAGNGSRPATNGSGPADNGSRPAPNGPGPADNGFGPTGNGYGPGLPADGSGLGNGSDPGLTAGGPGLGNGSHLIGHGPGPIDNASGPGLTTGSSNGNGNGSGLDNGTGSGGGSPDVAQNVSGTAGSNGLTGNGADSDVGSHRSDLTTNASGPGDNGTGPNSSSADPNGGARPTGNADVAAHPSDTAPDTPPDGMSVVPACPDPTVEADPADKASDPVTAAFDAVGPNVDPSGATPAGDPARNPATSAHDLGQRPGQDTAPTNPDVTVVDFGLGTSTHHASTSPAWSHNPRSAPSKPSPTQRPMIIDAPPIPVGAVPNPRSSGPIDPVSGLRRRIPQAHLSAELRVREPESVEPVINYRSTADAAAALSRYQASRAAAQAAVGNTTPRDTADDAESTTNDHANGGRA